MSATILVGVMPRMDGYRLCYEIRKHARLHDLAIIIYTSTYTRPAMRSWRWTWARTNT